MTVGVMIVTHGELGEVMLDTARNALGYCPLQSEVLSIPQDSNVEEMDAMAKVICMRLDSGEGVLVLADMFGSTPCNIAMRLISTGSIAVVSGLNLPMLMRVMNYPSLGLFELVNKALSGGHDGVVLCDNMV